MNASIEWNIPFILSLAPRQRGIAEGIEALTGDAVSYGTQRTWAQRGRMPANRLAQLLALYRFAGIEFDLDTLIHVGMGKGQYPLNEVPAYRRGGLVRNSERAMTFKGPGNVPKE